jgi:RNA polymerase sigma factor (TIGR02999 family)
LPQVYSELRRRAAVYLRRERRSHTLQPTALVHEAYAQLASREMQGFRGRTHFLAVASVAMRRVLVDHARARRALKRGRNWLQVSLDEIVSPESRVDDILAVDQALDRLAGIDTRAARIVEMRFFAGMTELEVAEATGMSERWVRKRWAFARAWLRRELQR